MTDLLSSSDSDRADEPLVRLADLLGKARSRADAATLVSRELRDLTGSSAVAVYLQAESGLALCGFAGSAFAEHVAVAPGIASRACSRAAAAHSDDSDLRELAVIGLHCSSALAVPLAANGAVLGALLLTMPVDDDLVADEGLVADVAALAAAALTAEPILSLAPAEARRDAVTAAGSQHARVLLVDDDPGLLALLWATFELAQVELEEARTATAASAAIAARPPDVIVLDIGLPDLNGLELCRRLKDDPETSWIGVVLLTGAGAEAERPARVAGADAIVHKPFSPLELLAVVERLAGEPHELPFICAPAGAADEQLLLYANDLRRLLELERGRREQLQRAHRQTVAALAGAVESKDVGTGSHSQRVQRYAIELARAIEPSLLLDPGVEYGFLLHDVGKIGIPDHILQKPGPLDEEERRLMRTHTLLGEQLLGDVDLLQGEGLNVVRWHHERWDGEGYPDGLARGEIPLAARIFALADALDAMTSDRPYRNARTWQDAAAELRAERGQQFDPDVVDAFRGHELALRGIQRGLAAA